MSCSAAATTSSTLDIGELDTVSPWGGAALRAPPPRDTCNNLDSPVIAPVFRCLSGLRWLRLLLLLPLPRTTAITVEETHKALRNLRNPRRWALDLPMSGGSLFLSSSICEMQRSKAGPARGMEHGDTVHEVYDTNPNVNMFDGHEHEQEFGSFENRRTVKMYCIDQTECTHQRSIGTTNTITHTTHSLLGRYLFYYP